MDIDDFRLLLDDKFNDKLNPIIKAIEKLEKSQEDIVGIMRDLAITNIEIRNLEANFHRAIEDNTQIHNALFAKARELTNDIKELQQDQGNKLWDTLKIIIASIFGGIVAWLAGNR